MKLARPTRHRDSSDESPVDEDWASLPFPVRQKISRRARQFLAPPVPTSGTYCGPHQRRRTKPD